MLLLKLRSRHWKRDLPYRNATVYRQINKGNRLLRIMDMCPCFFQDCDLAKDSGMLCLCSGALFQRKADKALGSEIRRTYPSMLVASVNWKIRTATCPLDT